MKGLEINDETTFEDLVTADPSSITVRSTGGPTFEYFAMAEWIRKHPDTSVHVTGPCGGGAVLMLAASNGGTMAPEAHLVFSNHVAVTDGSAERIRDTAKMLSGIDDAFAVAVSRGSRLTKGKVGDLMGASVVFTPEMAIISGLAASQDAER